MVFENTELNSVRAGRHAAKVLVGRVEDDLRGREGLTQDEQVATLEQAYAAAAELTEVITRTIELAKHRDFEAHQAEKDAAEAEGADRAPSVDYIYEETMVTQG